MTVDINTLFTSETATRILSAGLSLAAALGLDTTTWREGDPTRTLMQFVANSLATRDSAATDFIRSGFLSSATGTWLTLLADEVYGVTRTAAVASTPSVTFSNGGGAVYAKDAGEVIVKASTGETFRSTEALSLASGGTATIDFVAEDAGADGTVGTDDVDTIVSTMLGVTITASTAAIGVDEQSDASVRTTCTDTLGALSANGPPDAYNAVVTDTTLTGDSEITRAATTEDASDGTVTVYVAGASGAVSGEAVALAQTAVELWSTPATVTPTATSATNAVTPVTYTVTGTDIPGTAEADITALVGAYLGGLAIGGFVSRSALVSLAQVYLDGVGSTVTDVTLTVPAASVDLAEGIVATPGTVTVTEV